MAIRLHPLAHFAAPALVAVALLGSGCPSPEDRWNEFLEATKDQRLDAGDEESGADMGDGDGDGDGGLPDLNGTFLFALETSLGPDLPLQFITTIENMVIGTDGMSATADFTFRPLSLDPMQSLTPRECLDETLTFPGVQFDADGRFEIDMGLVMTPGEANPVTGSDIEATLIVLGHIEHDDALCGELEGMLLSPLEFNLAGSTFGAMRLEDDGCTPSTLPMSFPYKCEMVQPPGADDYSGYFLFALETSLGPDLPLQFVTHIVYSAAPEGGGTMDITFQPLSLEPMQSLTPREFVGVPITYEDIAVTPDGAFDIDMGLVMVTGEANPVTGSDIEATLIVHGDMLDENTACGELEGMLLSPLEFNLAGSTFAAIRLGDDGSNPMTLPTMFPYSCDMI
jgi:hypothetical protein